MPDDTKPTTKVCGQKLADWRQQAGLTQTALAQQVGVSRQFFNQLEGGRVLPNVVIALRLASALGRTVEELFGDAAAAADEQLHINLANPGTAAGSRLRLGRIGRTWVAHEADTAGTLAAGFGSADAVLEAPGRARLLASPAGAAANLLIAGCDPALALLQSPAEPPQSGRCHWIDCSSGRALDLLAGGLVHVAGIHYAGTNGAGNIEELRRRDPSHDWALVRFTRWEQGWLLRRDAGRTFAGVASLAGKKWVLINRDVSAAARRWLDHELAKAGIAPEKIPGYTTCASSAAEGARAVACGQADVAIGPRAAAAAHGLDFLPAEAVDFDLVATSIWWRSVQGRELIRRVTALNRAGLLASLPGYAATQTGEARPRTKRRTA